MLLRGSTVKVSISVLLVLVFLSFCFIYDYILHGEDYCHKKLLISRAKPMIKNPETLNTEDFISQYITLSEKVNSLHPGEKLVSFFHYFLDIHVTMKNKILIAVVTTEKYLLTRAVSIQKTWARDILPHSKLYFFVGEGCNISHPKLKSLPIIKMRGIQDNIYPPQKKVFAVLTYIYLHFGRDFKWFIRADDDVYIRMDRLEALLDQLEWTELMYLGHPGYGKLSDRKRLKLLDHENYCMGGPGIVFSATALEALYPHLGRCLMAVEHYNFKKEQEIWWYNEDVELGRCVSRTLGIHCSPKIKESMKYFYYDYESQALDPVALWREASFRDLITLHPVKHPHNLLSVHHFYKTLQYQTLSLDLVHRHYQIKQLCKDLPPHLRPHPTNKSDLSCSYFGA